MKVPLSWLKEYVDFEADARTLAERLTLAGVEVENIEKSGTDKTGKPEYVLNLEITPNRPDLLGIIGIARETAALFGTKLKVSPVKLQESSTGINDYASVLVEDKTGCPRYTARVLTNVKVGNSPSWLSRRLELAGIGIINNIVDITNYVMLECGQPLHAFDLNLLAERKIIVRRARNAEIITTLDGIKRNLTREMLVIADASRPVAIAGVMGGTDTGIQSNTTTVLLESAYFQPALIRRTSKTLELTSDSSYRFERGVDINFGDYASQRACAMMAEIASAQPAHGVIDIFPAKPEKRKITCRYSRTSDLLGIEIPPERILSIFKSLELAVVKEEKDKCLVCPPAFRPDLEIEADLIEEVARIHGFDKIPVRDPYGRVAASTGDRPIRALLHCRNILAALGLREIVNYSFVSEKLLNTFDAALAGQRIIIPRPVSADHSILRDSLLPQMVDTLGRNKSRQAEEAALFEIGRIFRKASAPYHEETRVAVGLMGAVGRSLLQKRKAVSEAEVFAWLKGIITAFHTKLFPVKSAGGNDNQNGAPASGGPTKALTMEDFTAGDNNSLGLPVGCFKQNRSVTIKVDGRPCGVMGLITDEIRAAWRILEPVGIMEMVLEPLLKHAFTTPAAAALPVYPSVKRDIAMRVPVNMRHFDIVKTIRKNAPKELTSIVLFDIYKGKEMGMGFKSLAYSLAYRSLDRTLTDEEVNKLNESVKTRLKNELKVEIRE
jgi:phenylalanyl-tRNA synthetase beta chain